MKDQVQLAFVDGKCKETEESDIYTTKLGGSPVWFNEPSAEFREEFLDKKLKCQECGYQKHLVLQAYCPLTEGATKDTDRVIYVFACNTRECCEKSWTVFRSTPISSSIPEKEKEEEYDDDDDDDDYELEDVSKTTKSFFSDDGWNSSSVNAFDNDDVDALMDQLSKISVAPIKKKSENSSSNFKPPQFDSINPFHDNCNADRAFPSLFLDIEDEEINEDEDELLEHAKDLFEIYQKSGEKMEEVAKASGIEWDEEAYEKSRFKDKTFFSFQARVQSNPSQCVRYKWNGTPLLYKEECKELVEKNKIPPCHLCGAERCHEMQLMPAILLELPIEDYANRKKAASSILDTNGLEFGTVHVFTCSENCCIQNGGNVAEEFLVLEME